MSVVEQCSNCFSHIHCTYSVAHLGHLFVVMLGLLVFQSDISKYVKDFCEGKGANSFTVAASVAFWGSVFVFACDFRAQDSVTLVVSLQFKFRTPLSIPCSCCHLSCSCLSRMIPSQKAAQLGPELQLRSVMQINIRLESGGRPWELCLLGSSYMPHCLIFDNAQCHSEWWMMCNANGVRISMVLCSLFYQLL